MRLRLLLTTLLLAACSTLGIQSEEQKIAAACASASAAMKVLIAANQAGKFSVAQQDGILSAIEIAAPICAAETPPTLDDVKRQAFVAAITVLTAAAADAAKEQQR